MVYDYRAGKHLSEDIEELVPFSDPLWQSDTVRVKVATNRNEDDQLHITGFGDGILLYLKISN